MFRAVFVLLCCIGASAFAQEQESKLLDRLLKPDMTLGNSAQDKHFTGVRQTTAKPVVTHEFAGTRETRMKEYSAHRAFVAWLFGRTRDFPRNRKAELVAQPAVPQKTFATRESPVRESSDAEKRVRTGDYAGERPFIAHGKSQKSLDAQRHEMSIDEVRELLNRNK